ncbi:hypothetical protein Dimus_028176 [Dionaea muscipula]
MADGPVRVLNCEKRSNQGNLKRTKPRKGDGVGSSGTNNVKQGLLVDEDRSIPCTSFIPESNVSTSLPSFFKDRTEAAMSEAMSIRDVFRAPFLSHCLTREGGGGSDANRGHATVPVSFSPSNRARSDDSPSQKSDSSDGSPSRYLDLSSFHGEL